MQRIFSVLELIFFLTSHFFLELWPAAYITTFHIGQGAAWSWTMLKTCCCEPCLHDAVEVYEEEERQRRKMRRRRTGYINRSMQLQQGWSVPTQWSALTLAPVWALSHWLSHSRGRIGNCKHCNRKKTVLVWTSIQITDVIKGFLWAVPTSLSFNCLQMTVA